MLLEDPDPEPPDFLEEPEPEPPPLDADFEALSDDPEPLSEDDLVDFTDLPDPSALPEAFEAFFEEPSLPLPPLDDFLLEDEPLPSPLAFDDLVDPDEDFESLSYDESLLSRLRFVLCSSLVVVAVCASESASISSTDTRVLRFLRTGFSD